MRKITFKRIRIVACMLLLGTTAGCNWEIDVNAAIAKANATNIKRLANLYFTFQMKNRWMGPQNEEEFKEFLKSYNPDKLTRIGIDPNAIDDLFINERDGQPFRIRYKIPGSAMGSSEPVIFEATGVDGKRLIGCLNMEQLEVDETDYERMWSGKSTPEKIVRNEPWQN